MDISFKRMTEKMVSKMELALDSVLFDYEFLLSLTEELTIKELCIALEKYSKQKPDWINNVYSQSVSLDMNLSSIVLYTQALQAKFISLESVNYLKFKKESLLNTLQVLSKFNTVETVDKVTIYTLAERVDKLLDKRSREYRVFRLICITQILGLYNITTSISCFTLSQELYS